MNAQESVTADTPAPLDAATEKRNRLVISLLLVSAFVVILNETIMGVAIPHLMRDLNASASAAQWLTTAFLLTMAIVIPITGLLLQRFNTRPVFIAAMTMFSLGTLVSALSPGLGMLIVGRVVQAVGTAIMMPLLMTTIMNLVPPETRGRTMGNISIVISVAPAIGPTISGLILSVLDWRWMFLLVLPIALASLALGAMRIVNVTTPRYAPIDAASVILSVFGFGGLVYGLSNMGAEATGPVSGWTALGVGVVAIAAFVRRQLALQREDRALLDLRTFASKTFSVSVVMMAISMMSLFGMLILLPIYMQNVLGLDALKTGLLLLPGGLVMGLLAPPVGTLYDKHGPTPLIVPGSVIVCGVMWALAMMNEQTPVAALLAAHVALSVGLALTFTPLFSASLGSLPPKFYSHGSAVIGSIQQVAGAAGTALFIAVMSTQAAAQLAAGQSQVLATSHGIRAAFVWGAAISIFMVVAAFFVRKPPTSPDMPHGH
ncbi:putative transport protein HsrA [compost metagenome]